MRIKIFIANKIYDVKRGGPALSVTMMLIFPKIVWTCPLNTLDFFLTYVFTLLLGSILVSK